MEKYLINAVNAPFTYTGKPRVKWHNDVTNTDCNSGEHCEGVHHWKWNGVPAKTPGAYWKCVDCEVFNASLKSDNCSLGEKAMSTNLKNHLKAYMAVDVAENYIWCSYNMDTNIMTEYVMNASEFFRFACKFARVYKDGVNKDTGIQKYRVKMRETAKMREYLNAHC